MIEYLTRILMFLLYRSIAFTWRFVGPVEVGSTGQVDAIIEGGLPASVLFAHGQMFPLWYHLRKTGGVPVVSQSRDGERLAWLLRQATGYDTILRGSSSHGGAEVLERMIETLATRSILMTPDGPRGPRGEAKAGGAVAAERSGRPVLVVQWYARNSLTFDTWDRMSIPLPFSKIYLRYCIFKPEHKPDTTAVITSISSILKSEYRPPDPESSEQSPM